MRSHLLNNDTERYKLTDSQFLLFEILERAARFLSHVDRSCRVASRQVSRSTAQLEIAERIKENVNLLIREAISILQSETDGAGSQQVLYKLNEVLGQLAVIHSTGLLYVPRPHEPIEILSYLRQTRKYNKKKSTNPPVVENFGKHECVFASEYLGDQALNVGLPNTLTAQFRDRMAMVKGAESPDTLLAFAQEMLHPPKGIERKYNQREYDQNPTGFISLPRIDLGNPARWPLLIHERGHQLLNSNSESLEGKFKRFLSDNGESGNGGFEHILIQIECLTSSTNKQRAENLLFSWLTECWCDAYAVSVAGPAVWFAQLHAFLFSAPSYMTERYRKDQLYPPAKFRLRLTKLLAQSRYETDQKLIDEIENLIRFEENKMFQAVSVQAESHEVDAALKVLSTTFLSFLRVQFSGQASDISMNDFEVMLADISIGLPIPSVQLSVAGLERASTVAEILLAGWFHRNKTLRDFVLYRLVKDFESIGGQNFEKFIEKLRTEVDRADESLKRSIQVAEWFDIFSSHASTSSKSEEPIQDEAVLSEERAFDKDRSGLLSDRDIKLLLKEKTLRIVPLIDSAQQIKGSVIDLRLGHNFEVFFANVLGTVDALSEGVPTQRESMDVDIDLLDGISISPGQFILGHTLEYVQLPNTVAAQIEGRSSFARLGLQVHMTANLVEAGFEGCLTLEIANCGHSTVKLYPGMRIAQLRFFRLTSEPQNPYSQKGGNKYMGLLSHNKTKQFSDREVEIMKQAIKQRRV